MVVIYTHIVASAHNKFSVGEFSAAMKNSQESVFEEFQEWNQRVRF